MRASDSAILGALYRLQESPLAHWVTGSSWALFFFLILHTLSMGLLAGTGVAIGLRTLGFSRRAPLSGVAVLLPIMQACLAVAVVSGVFLVVGYPAKALTNPVFYAKLALAAAALALTWRLASGVSRAPDQVQASASARRMAAAAIVAWPLAIAGGRFLAYTAPVTLLRP